MNEDEILVAAECEAVVNYISATTAQPFSFEQISADTKDFKIIHANRVLYRNSLANCQVFLAGMLALAEVLKES